MFGFTRTQRSDSEFGVEILFFIVLTVIVVYAEINLVHNNTDLVFQVSIKEVNACQGTSDHCGHSGIVMFKFPLIIL